MKSAIKLLLRKMPRKLSEKIQGVLWRSRARAFILVCPALKHLAPAWGGRFPLRSMPRGVVRLMTTWATVREIPGPSCQPWTNARTLGEKRLEDYQDVQVIPPAIFLAELANGVIDGATGAVMDFKGQMVAELSTYSMRAPVEQPWDHPVFFRFKGCKDQDISGNVVLLSNPNAHVYFHWLLEILPRLGILKEHELLPAEFTCLVPSTDGFFADSLRTAGIPRSKLIAMEPGIRYRAEKLITTSDIYPQGMVASFAPYLREMFLPPEEPVVRQKLIYISRRVAGLRPVVNESELIQIVEELGGELAILEGMAMRDQAALFQSATCIITPHGSALSNLVFCRPGTRVLELFAGAYVRRLYPWIGTAMQLDYWYLIGKSVRNQREENSLYAAIEVDKDIFRRTLLEIVKPATL